jgi:hypothetical protein
LEQGSQKVPRTAGGTTGSASGHARAKFGLVENTDLTGTQKDTKDPSVSEERGEKVAE